MVSCFEKQAQVSVPISFLHNQQGKSLGYTLKDDSKSKIFVLFQTKCLYVSMCIL